MTNPKKAREALARYDQLMADSAKEEYLDTDEALQVMAEMATALGEALEPAAPAKVPGLMARRTEEIGA